MKRRLANKAIHLMDLVELLPEKLHSPLCVLLGSTQEVADFLSVRGDDTDVIFQNDLHYAGQLQKELDFRGLSNAIQMDFDLWNLNEKFATLVYPVPESGERSFKLDVLEHAYHALQHHGVLVVLSPFDKDNFFPTQLKKIFGKVHMPSTEGGQIFWCRKEGDKPKRRHEMTFHAQRPDAPSLHFVTWPGVFSYGRFDNGARALVECMEIKEGDSILDLGCGCGTNGIHAGLIAGENGKVVFVDSNLRAIELSRINAEHNGLKNFECIASANANDLNLDSFDVVLANPPYFAQHAVARLFMEAARKHLKDDGTLYLVTKQPEEIGEMIVQYFRDAEFQLQRGYSVFSATDPIRR